MSSCLDGVRICEAINESCKLSCKGGVVQGGGCFSGSCVRRGVVELASRAREVSREWLTKHKFLPVSDPVRVD